MNWITCVHIKCYVFFSRIPGSEWALGQAKRNLAEHYLLVGVTEELQDFIALLEAALPQYFRGATSLFIEGEFKCYISLLNSAFKISVNFFN